MIPLEEEDPMDAVLALADMQPGVVAPEQNRMAPPMPTMPAPKQPAPVDDGWINAETPQAPQKVYGDVDPELAFMAAYSKNPVLMQMFQQQRDKPQLEAEAQRKQEKWQMERDMYAPEKLKKLQLGNAGAAAGLEGKDPKSAYSQAMRQALSRSLGMQAQRMAASGSPLAAQMQQAAQAMASDNISADRAEAIAKAFGKFGDSAVADARNASRDVEASRMNDAKIGHMGEQDKQGWARLQAQRDRTLAPRQSPREKAVNAKLQEKLDDEIEKADWARNMLLRVADLKKNVNTGPVAGRLQNLGQEVGLSSSEFDAMKQTLSQVTNRIIKELSGSAVTGNEWSRMQDELANILNDDANFATKLANMIELTESIKQRAINRYTRVGDAPANPTNTAARVTAGKPQVRAGETAPPDATPGAKPAGDVNSAPDGARAFSKSQGKYFVRKGGKWVPE